MITYGYCGWRIDDTRIIGGWWQQIRASAAMETSLLPCGASVCVAFTRSRSSGSNTPRLTHSTHN